MVHAFPWKIGGRGRDLCPFSSAVLTFRVLTEPGPAGCHPTYECNGTPPSLPWTILTCDLDFESRNGHSPSTSAAPSYRHHTGYHHLTSECLVSLLFEAIRWWCHPEVHIQLSSSHLIVTKPIFVFCWSLSHMVHTFPWKIGGRRRETSVLLAPLFWHFVFWLNLDRPDVIQHMNVMELLPRYREPF